MIDKIVPRPSDRAAAKRFMDKLEGTGPVTNDLDSEYRARPPKKPKRSREEIDRLTAELFAKLETEKRAAGGAK